MNILMVNYEWPPLGGGGGVAMETIARELAQRHTVHVLTSGAGGLPSEETIADGRITVFRCPAFLRHSQSVASIASMLAFWPLSVRLGKNLLRRYRYDVINTWFAIPSGPAGVGIAKRGGIPHVLTIIGGDIYDPSKWYSPHRNPLLKLVVRSVLRKANRHTAISRDIETRTRDIYGFDRTIDVISLGITEPMFEPRTRQDLGLQGDVTYLVSVGRIVRRKDYPSLLAALKKVERDDVHLLLLGDGPERSNLEALSKQLGIAERVQFRGFVSEEEKYQLLAAADVFVLTSLHEGFGLVYLEAMHCGLPIIASRTGGQIDFLTEGETGYLAQTGDAESLASALRRMLAKPEIRAAMGERNRELVKSYYASATAGRYEQLFAAACGMSRKESA